MSHTPGPWSLYPETDGTEIYAVDMVPGLPIRQMIARPVHGENWIANAHLIAAAPDLLEALILMVRTHDEPAETLLQEAKEQKWLAQARAAIAKATQ